MPLGLGKIQISASCHHLDISKFLLPQQASVAQRDQKTQPQSCVLPVTPVAPASREESWVMLKEAERESGA